MVVLKKNLKKRFVASTILRFFSNGCVVVLSNFKEKGLKVTSVKQVKTRWPECAPGPTKVGQRSVRNEMVEREGLHEISAKCWVEVGECGSDFFFELLTIIFD